MNLALRSGFLAAVVASLPLVVFGQTQGLGQPTFPAPAIGASAAALYQSFINYWEWKLANSPETATSVGRREYNDRWRDWSKAARDNRRARLQDFLRDALYIGTGNLTASDRLSAQMLEYELDTTLASETWVQLTSGVSQAEGAHNTVFFIIDQMPAGEVKDYENSIARLEAIPAYVDQVIAMFTEQLESGLAQPAVVIDLTLEQVVAQGRPS